jgi:hypothetical protein
MSDQGNDKVKTAREFWDLFCSLHKSKGIDLPEFLHSLARQVRESLSPWAAKADFDELCRKGCSEVSLALAFWSFEIAQSVERVWRKTVPSARRRQQVVQTLDNAADVLEELQNSVDLAVLEELKKSFPGYLSESGTSDREILSTVSRMEPEWPTNAPAPAPTTVVRALRLYAQTLNLFRAISEETEAHSWDSVPRYLISAYVKRATGSFSDAPVAALIGKALGTEAYDETAHRMWRFRNYERLQKEYALLIDILAGIGAVTGPNA